MFYRLKSKRTTITKTEVKFSSKLQATMLQVIFATQILFSICNLIFELQCIQNTTQIGSDGVKQLTKEVATFVLSLKGKLILLHLAFFPSLQIHHDWICFKMT